MANPSGLEASLQELANLTNGFGDLTTLYESIRVTTEEAAIPEDAWPLAATMCDADDAYGTALTSLRDAAEAGAAVFRATHGGLANVVKHYANADGASLVKRLSDNSAWRGYPVNDSRNAVLDATGLVFQLGAVPPVANAARNVVKAVRSYEKPLGLWKLTSVYSPPGSGNIRKALWVLKEVKGVAAASLAGATMMLAISVAAENVRSFEPFEAARRAWRDVTDRTSELHDTITSLLPQVDKLWSGDASDAFVQHVRTRLLQPITELGGLADRMAAFCEAMIHELEAFLKGLIWVGCFFLASPAVMLVPTAQPMTLAAAGMLASGLGTLAASLGLHISALVPKARQIAEDGHRLAAGSGDKARQIDQSSVTGGKPVGIGWQPQT